MAIYAATFFDTADTLGSVFDTQLITHNVDTVGGAVLGGGMDLSSWVTYQTVIPEVQQHSANVQAAYVLDALEIWDDLVYDAVPEVSSEYTSVTLPADGRVYHRGRS